MYSKNNISIKCICLMLMIFNRFQDVSPGHVPLDKPPLDIQRGKCPGEDVLGDVQERDTCQGEMSMGEISLSHFNHSKQIQNVAHLHVSISILAYPACPGDISRARSSTIISKLSPILSLASIVIQKFDGLEDRQYSLELFNIQ